MLSVLMFEIKNNKIELKKDLNDLDKFVIDFVKLLKIKYVIVSGYVSILFGRTRGSEDVDILIEKLDKKRFVDFYKSVTKKEFYCLNTSKVNEAYEYLETGHAIRFARINEAVPNMEIKFIKDRKDEYVLNNPIKVSINRLELNVAQIESQIVYKKYKLMSDKDIEDARHLEILFKDQIDKNKIKLFESWWKNGQ